MENKIMEIIYDKIKDINFYNYDNDKRLKEAGIELESEWGENRINILIHDEGLQVYTITIKKNEEEHE